MACIPSEGAILTNYKWKRHTFGWGYCGLGVDLAQETKPGQRIMVLVYLIFLSCFSIGVKK